MLGLHPTLLKQIILLLSFSIFMTGCGTITRTYIDVYIYDEIVYVEHIWEYERYSIEQENDSERW